MSQPPARKSTSAVTVYVCTQCGMAAHPLTGKTRPNPQARALVEAIRKSLGPAGNIIVRLTRCLGDCAHPLAYAFTGTGRETLVFGNGGTVGPHTIAAAARTYAAKRPGTRYQRADIPPEQKGTIFARIPPPQKARPS